MNEKELVEIWINEGYEDWLSFDSFKRMVEKGKIEVKKEVLDD